MSEANDDVPCSPHVVAIIQEQNKFQKKQSLDFQESPVVESDPQKYKSSNSVKGNSIKVIKHHNDMVPMAFEDLLPQTSRTTKPRASSSAHKDDQTDEVKFLGQYPIDSQLPEPEDESRVVCDVIKQAERFVRHVWKVGWKATHHHSLPQWLKDNDFLIRGHRPELKSFKDCFQSVFRVHTETGNIWTHLLGGIAFLGIFIFFVTRSDDEIAWEEKAVFSTFFLSAFICMAFSTLFHTVYCHSEKVGKFFNKLDYCGIALLTMGSFVPWMYYSFYCYQLPKLIYLLLITALGITSIILSMWSLFSAPQFRALRAGVFIGLGLSGVIPCIHYVVLEGFQNAFYNASLGWLILMAVLYIGGALIYTVRIPERFFPGKFDIWFQSHQIFHVFVVAAALVHHHGISQIANYRLTRGDCGTPLNVISTWSSHA